MHDTTGVGVDGSYWRMEREYWEDYEREFPFVYLPESGPVTEHVATVQVFVAPLSRPRFPWRKTIKTLVVSFDPPVGATQTRVAHWRMRWWDFRFEGWWVKWPSPEAALKRMERNADFD